MTTPTTTERMEEAREVVKEIGRVAFLPATNEGQEGIASIIARALSASEAKGRQDGVREGMKRAAEIARTGFYTPTMAEAEALAAAILSNIDEANQ